MSRVVPHHRHSDEHEDKSWNKYETAGATLSRNHAKQKKKFDASQQAVDQEQAEAQAKLKRTQSKEAAKNEFVTNPEMVIKIGHVALRQGAKDIQSRANKLGTGTAVIMTKAALEKFLRALNIQHSDNMLDLLDAHSDGDSSLASSYSDILEKAKEVEDGLQKAGSGEHKYNEILKRELVPELVDVLQAHMDNKEKILHPLFAKVAGKTPAAQAKFLGLAIPEMSTQFMIEYTIKSSRLVTDFDDDTVRHYCETIRMMAPDAYDDEIQPQLQKTLGSDLWKKMAELGLDDVV